MHSRIAAATHPHTKVQFLHAPAGSSSPGRAVYAASCCHAANSSAGSSHRLQSSSPLSSSCCSSSFVRVSMKGSVSPSGRPNMARRCRASTGAAAVVKALPVCHAGRRILHAQCCGSTGPMLEAGCTQNPGCFLFCSGSEYSCLPPICPSSSAVCRHLGHCQVQAACTAHLPEALAPEGLHPLKVAPVTGTCLLLDARALSTLCIKATPSPAGHTS